MRAVSNLVAALLSIALAASAQAQHRKAGATVKTGVTTTRQFVNTRKGGQEVTCQDFMGLADQYKPQAISYVIGVTKGLDPSAKVVDVTSVGRLVPVVVSTCRSRPHGALRDTVSTVLYSR